MRRILLGLAIFGSLGKVALAEAPAVFPAARTEKPAPAVEVLQDVSPGWRSHVLPIVEKSTVSARGPAETFQCQPEHYEYFLDHPDRAVVAWRRIGAKCVNILPKGPGRYGWTDDHGSEMTWSLIARSPGLRMWYADGKIKPGQVLPAIPGKAVVVLRYQTLRKDDGIITVQQQTDLYVLTDNVTAAIATKLVGGSLTRYAEQGIGNMQTFFSALSWYLERHPDRVDELLRPES
jgi:hypothetical protein